MTIVALDVDECLLRWLPSFERYVYLRGWKSVPTTSYDLAQRYPDHHPSDILTMIEKFHASYEYRRIPEMPFASKILNELKDEFPHVTFIAVTACGLDPKTLQARSWQLRDFPIADLIAVPYTRSKADAYARISPRVVIDDHPEHLRTAETMGAQPIVFDQPWNIGCDYPRLTSWKDAYPVLAPLLKKEFVQ